MNLQEAIDAPAFHTEHAPSSSIRARAGRATWRSGPLPARDRRGAAAARARVEVRDDWSLGRVTAAARDGRLLKAAANPRHMQDYAIGR